MPYSVYLLRSVPAPLRTYVGVSNNVDARLRAHNGLSGKGAAATRAQRPWEIYAVVSGFESEHRALCFEFAWHYPKKVGYAVLHVHLVKSMKMAYASLRRATRDWVRGEDGVEWHLRVLDEMLELELWRGMGLEVHYPLGRALPGACAAAVGAAAVGAAAVGAAAGAGLVQGAGGGGRAAVPGAGRARSRDAERVRARGARRGAWRAEGRGAGAGGAGRGRVLGVAGCDGGIAAPAGQDEDCLIVVDDAECDSVGSASSSSVIVL